MRYFYTIVYTPFCGEEAEVWIAAVDENMAHQIAIRAAHENGMEWFDEEAWLERQGYDKDEDAYDEVCDEYYAQCGHYALIEVTEKEYRKMEEQGDWTI